VRIGITDTGRNRIGQDGRALPARQSGAAMGYWHSSATPELVLFAWPDKHSHENLGAITLSNRGGSWLKQDAKGVYQGLDHYAGMGPPVALTFWSLQIAVLLGLCMLAVSWLTLLMTLRKGLDPSTLPSWWLRVLIGMMFSGGAAVMVGWWVNVIGSQPYVVSNTITQAEVLGTVSRGALAWGLGGFAVVYVVLLAAFISMLFYAARYGVVPVRKAGGAS
jgi:cytochrome bd ubiquinol oxidase subunit I